VRPLAMAAHGTSPCFGMTPGSTYSTPTLTLGQAGGMAARSQVGMAGPGGGSKFTERRGLEA
jgi:hypothetical protein